MAENGLSEDRRIDVLNRVLDPGPVESLEAYRSAGGGKGHQNARWMGGADVATALEAAGLRGRGGAGFPTALKWRTVMDFASPTLPGTVVVNAAEGEPGSYKDRHLLLTNPYKVLEGAAIAAASVGADAVVVATKQSFTDVVARLRAAIDELESSGLFEGGPTFNVVEGPDDYLFGEETALLEVVEGREAKPRVSPPFKHGVDDPDQSGTASDTQLATEGSATDAAPVLVNNVETLAHVSDILRHGADWFREHGTDEGGGTFLCTVTGDTERSAVVELPVGATLADALEHGGGGMAGQPMGALLGASHPIVRPTGFDTPLGYGSDGTIPIGSGSFMFFSTDADPVAVTAGVARFLSTASCAQCEPCKEDGTAMSDALDELAFGTPSEEQVRTVQSRVTTVADGARCALARQHRDIVEATLADFPDALSRRIAADAPSLRRVEISPPTSIES